MPRVGITGTQTLCGPYTADIQSLYSEYTGCADWRMPDFEAKSWKWIRNRSIWLRSGSYSYRMDPTGSGKPLGCLPGLETPLENQKIMVFQVFQYFQVFSDIFLSSLNSNRPAFGTDSRPYWRRHRTRGSLWGGFRTRCGGPSNPRVSYI